MHSLFFKPFNPMLVFSNEMCIASFLSLQYFCKGLRGKQGVQGDKGESGRDVSC